MEDKKSVKISIGTIICIMIIILLVITILGILYYYNNFNLLSNETKISKTQNMEEILNKDNETKISKVQNIEKISNKDNVYKIFGNSNGLTYVKLYSNNNLTVNFNKEIINTWKNQELDLAYYPNGEDILANNKIQGDKEYNIDTSIIKDEIKQIYIFDNYTPTNILILTNTNKLYYVKTVAALSSEKFEIVQLTTGITKSVKEDATGILVTLIDSEKNVTEEYVVRGADEEVGLALWTFYETEKDIKLSNYVCNFKGFAY